MRLSAKWRATGFSLIELVLALAVAIVLIAVGLPAFLRAYRFYELNSAARQMADILRLARYEAIRLNKPVNCVIQATASAPPTTNVWVDADLDGVLDPAEKMVLLDGSGNLVAAPGTVVPISGQIGTNAIVTPSPTSSSVQFDGRGAVLPPPPGNTGVVNVFYLSSAVAPDAGYRAVVLMPAGSIQVWTSDTSGNWQFQQ
jgi:type II secretory pathway pseudopilin PulG